MPTILRAGRGMTLWEKARQDLPPKMLELFSYENNLVRVIQKKKKSDETRVLQSLCGLDDLALYIKWFLFADILVCWTIK